MLRVLVRARVRKFTAPHVCSLHVFEASEQFVTGPYTISISSWYTLRLAANGSTVMGWINGENVFKFATPGYQVSSGWCVSIAAHGLARGGG